MASIDKEKLALNFTCKGYQLFPNESNNFAAEVPVKLINQLWGQKWPFFLQTIYLSRFRSALLPHRDPLYRPCTFNYVALCISANLYLLQMVSTQWQWLENEPHRMFWLTPCSNSKLFTFLGGNMMVENWMSHSELNYYRPRFVEGTEGFYRNGPQIYIYI